MKVAEPFHSVREPVNLIKAPLNGVNNRSRTVLPVTPPASSVSVGRLVAPKFSKQGQKPGVIDFVGAAASRRGLRLQPFEKMRARPAPSSCNGFHRRSFSGKGVCELRFRLRASFAASVSIHPRRFSCPAPVPTRESARVSHPQILRSSLRTAPLLVTGLLLVRPQSCVCF